MFSDITSSCTFPKDCTLGISLFYRVNVLKNYITWNISLHSQTQQMYLSFFLLSLLSLFLIHISRYVIMMIKIQQDLLEEHGKVWTVHNKRCGVCCCYIDKSQLHSLCSKVHDTITVSLLLCFLLLFFSSSSKPISKKSL